MAYNFRFAQLQPFVVSGAGVIQGSEILTLKSFNDIDGTPLTMDAFGGIGFGTLEPGNGTQEEQISFIGVVQNADGTASLTGVNSITFLYPYSNSDGLAKTHPGSTTFVISNTSGFYNQFVAKDDDGTISETLTFTVPNYPQVNDSTTFPTQQAQFATKAYADSLTFAGAPNATTTVKGIVQLATQAQIDAKTSTGSTGATLVATPAEARSTLLSDYIVDTGTANAYAITPLPAIAAYTVGQIFSFKATHTNTTTSTLNVSSLGTQTIKKASGNNVAAGDILNGQIVIVEYDGTNFQLINDVAPDSATQVGVQNSSYVYAASSAGTDTYAITVTPTPSAYVVGQVFYFKADVGNTGAATLNVNTLGAIAITKNVSAALNTGDIGAGQIVEVQYDGTNFQMQSARAQGFIGLYSNGTTTYDVSTASGTQNIAHGLGVTPTVFNVVGFLSSGNSIINAAQSFNSNAIATFLNANNTVGNFATFTFTTSGGSATATITATSTNIVLTWVKTSSPTGTAELLWSAMA